MKTLIAILITLSSFNVFARSMMLSPSVKLEVGAKADGKNWAVCEFTAFALSIEKSDGTKSVTRLALDRAELLDAVQGSVKSPLVTTRLYIAPKNPSITVKVAVAPTMKETVIFKDASRQEKRNNADTNDILAQVKSVCASVLKK